MEKVSYTYTSSIDYINGLEFDYLETYSLQRGKDFENNFKLIKTEYENLEERKESGKTLTNSEETRFAELNEHLGFTQYLINERGEFHPSSTKINTFEQNHPAVENLKTILRSEIKEIPRFLCAPDYRDPIVFYNENNQIVSCLNVWLSCNHMETKKFSHINGDWQTYDLLKQFFLEIGHDVENPDYFFGEDMQKRFLKKLKV